MVHLRRTTTRRGYGHRWQKLRLLILRRDGGRCHWCGRPARSVDHVVPKADGGTDDPANLVAACTRCNSSRSLAWNRQHRTAPRSPPSRDRREGPTGALAT